MDELVKGVFTAPVATLFIVSGMIFLLIAVISKRLYLTSNVSC